MDAGGIGARRAPGRSSVAALLMLSAAVVGSALIGGCATAAPDDPPPEVSDGGSTFDAASLRWDPSVVAAATPGLVGWRREDSADPGALIALGPDRTQAEAVWEAPEIAGVALAPLAVDAGGQRMLLEVNYAGAGNSLVTGLAMMGPDGTSRGLELPEGYESVSSATFVGGRALVVAYHATQTTFETQIGVFSEAGEWQSVSLEGPVPDHQFVEWVASAPGIDGVAVLLKVPGGVGDRDDDALVFARFESGVLRAYTDAFMDDSLPAASPLYAAEGVVYPRTWREVDGVPVVDLIVARWNGTAWDEETVLADGAIASGIETGHVAAQGADGALWIRSAPDDAGRATLMRLEGSAAKPQPTATVLDSIDWFAWIDGGAE